MSVPHQSRHILIIRRCLFPARALPFLQLDRTHSALNVKDNKTAVQTPFQKEQKLLIEQLQLLQQSHSIND